MKAKPPEYGYRKRKAKEEAAKAGPVSEVHRGCEEARGGRGREGVPGSDEQPAKAEEAEAWKQLELWDSD